MITSVDIRKKSERLWQSGKVLSTYLQEKNLFPWLIPFRKPSIQQQVEKVIQTNNWINSLIKFSKTKQKLGSYTVKLKNFNHKQLGTQSLPYYVYFSTQEDFLIFLGKTREFEFLKKLIQYTQKTFPDLMPWIIQNPQALMKYQLVWLDLLKICQYFLDHPQPQCYIRELEIPHVNHDLINQYPVVLDQLLVRILPTNTYDKHIDISEKQGFERRYGLKQIPPMIRLRLLDEALISITNVSDFIIPVYQLANWKIDCENVFITDSEINGLTFPLVKNSLVIFNLNDGIESLKQIPWLAVCKIFYWGDISLQGFTFLSQLRKNFPMTKSLLMDEDLLATYEIFATTEKNNLKNDENLANLSSKENKIYQRIRQTSQCLKQEQVSLSRLEKELLTL